jgi:hypothetical protein
MITVIIWESADSCPDCGTRLIQLDDGAAIAGLECGSCGYLDTWTATGPGGGER